MDGEREGGDITAEHMNRTVVPSDIQKYYAGSTIFVTGGTGILGRLLIEKLLRSCPDVKKIYILIRPKNAKTSEERFQEYFNDPLYDRLKREQYNSLQKLRLITGDCALAGLGLKKADEDVLINEVNSVFHFGAATCLDQKFGIVVRTNIGGTIDVLKLAKRIKDLKSFIYLSTVYGFCLNKTIDEVFYESPMPSYKLIKLLNTLSENQLEETAHAVTKEWPGNYTFSMAVAEDIVRKESLSLPLAILRPSSVISTAEEPMAGWINSFYGITGILMATVLGVIRTLNVSPTYIAEVVPADFVINAALAAAWDIAEKTKNLHLNEETPNEERDESSIPIYNYVSSVQKPITCDEIVKLGHQHTEPTVQQVWHFYFWFSPNKYLYTLWHYLLHIIPAYVIDTFAFCLGKKQRMKKIYKNFEKMWKYFEYYTVREMTFRNDNTQGLWNKLNNEDRRLFQFDISRLDWDLYYRTCMRGGRLYLLKDSLDTIPEGQLKQKKLMIVHYSLMIILGFGIVQFFLKIWTLIF